MEIKVIFLPVALWIRLLKSGRTMNAFKRKFLGKIMEIFDFLGNF